MSLLGQVLVTVSLAASAALGGLRWLRVGQREHYLAGSVTRFALRWWLLSPPSVGLIVLGIVGAALTWWWWPAALVVALVVAVGPPGLGVRGSTSPLAWTSRLRRLAGVTGSMMLVALALGVVFHRLIPTLAVLGLPVLLDLALASMAPWERRAGRAWVDKAAAALRASAPRWWR